MAKSKAPTEASSSESTPKSKCPITLEQFREHAKTVPVVIGDRTVSAGVKEFSSGSLGWYANDKVVMKIDGVEVKVQVGLNLTIIGSKPAPLSE
jgi:hypothetical protein